MAHPDPRQTPGRYRTLVGGLHTTPALIRNPGRWAGVQLGLSPLGGHALLGVPASELAGIDVDLAEVLGPLAPELADRLETVRDWPTRFQALDDVLLRAAARPPRRLPR